MTRGFSNSLRGILDFKGRARRTDFLVYYLGSGLIAFILYMLMVRILPFQTALSAARVIQVILLIPLPALFVRRLHDQNLTGWWATIALPVFAIQIWYESNDVSQTVYGLFHPLRLIAILCIFTAIVLLFSSGTDGPNRFGPDPRHTT